MPISLVVATTTVGGDASWIVVPVIVLVVVLVTVNARRAGPGGALQEAGRSAPHAVASVIGTVLVVAGGGATAVTAGLLPFALIVEAIGGHVLGTLFVVLLAAIGTLLIGAALLGRGLRELLSRRR
ncbi:MAG: hypothetical protein QOE11_1649 [Solirubrobacteraceae bacterium]|jgi:hypothetical protein|nr:hypothetical protein [Solirubrobacteraceae bacterium]